MCLIDICVYYKMFVQYGHASLAFLDIFVDR